MTYHMQVRLTQSLLFIFFKEIKMRKRKTQEPFCHVQGVRQQVLLYRVLDYPILNWLWAGPSQQYFSGQESQQKSDRRRKKWVGLFHRPGTPSSMRNCIYSPYRFVAWNCASSRIDIDWPESRFGHLWGAGSSKCCVLVGVPFSQGHSGGV